MSRGGRPLDPDFLGKYERESVWAPAQGISYPTSRRYRLQGMPYLMWGGSVYIPKAEARDWIAARVQRRSPTRRKRQVSTSAEMSAR